MVQVIDASVAIKWFVEEDGQDEALHILAGMLDNPGHFAVPELFYFELVHILYRLVPSLNKGQNEVLGQVLTLGIHRFSMTPDLNTQIRHFQGMGLSGYDAAYVGLAKMLKGVWLTFDREAHLKVARFKVSRLLGE